MFVLTRSEGIEYGLLERGDVEEMVELMASVFSRYDPPAVAAGLSIDDLRELAARYSRRAPDDGLTLIARSQSSGELIGAMLNEDFASPPPEPSDGLPVRFKPIVALLDTLGDQYRKGQQIMPGEVLHLFMLAVAPEFKGRGIAHSLVRLTLDNGRQKGYQRAVTEATGTVSQHIFRNHGFIERFRIPYRTFIYEGKHAFNTIIDHEAILLLERHLVV